MTSGIFEVVMKIDQLLVVAGIPFAINSLLLLMARKLEHKWKKLK
ncbi:hypothetical protein NTGBS_950039 [Candidatus Nitrotoga sp. BS]|nr:hypothetical protein [Candidatus Nitrotoga sp. BS]CAH1212709.1 hypothetical protein NTGBS_950039 [Candidatus Nitrotoga sp. BS]